MLKRKRAERALCPDSHCIRLSDQRRLKPPPPNDLPPPNEPRDGLAAKRWPKPPPPKPPLKRRGAVVTGLLTRIGWPWILPGAVATLPALAGLVLILPGRVVTLPGLPLLLIVVTPLAGSVTIFDGKGIWA